MEQGGIGPQFCSWERLVPVASGRRVGSQILSVENSSPAFELQGVFFFSSEDITWLE